MCFGNELNYVEVEDRPLQRDVIQGTIENDSPVRKSLLSTSALESAIYELQVNQQAIDRSKPKAFDDTLEYLNSLGLSDADKRVLTDAVSRLQVAALTIGSLAYEQSSGPSNSLLKGRTQWAAAIATALAFTVPFPAVRDGFRAVIDT